MLQVLIGVFPLRLFPLCPQFIPISSLCHFAPFSFPSLPICPIPTLLLSCVAPFLKLSPYHLAPSSFTPSRFAPFLFCHFPTLPLFRSALSCFAPFPFCPFPVSPISNFAHVPLCYIKITYYLPSGHFNFSGSGEKFSSSFFCGLRQEYLSKWNKNC